MTWRRRWGLMFPRWLRRGLSVGEFLCSADVVKGDAGVDVLSDGRKKQIPLRGMTERKAKAKAVVGFACAETAAS